MLDIYPTANHEDSVKPKKWHSKVSITSDYFSTYSKSFANDDGVSHFCNDKPLSGFPQLQPKPKPNQRADEQIVRKGRVYPEQSKHTVKTARQHTRSNKSTFTKEVTLIY